MTRSFAVLALLLSLSVGVYAQENTSTHGAWINSSRVIFESELAGYCVNMARYFSKTARSLANEPGLNTVSKNALAKDVGRFNSFVASAVETFEFCNQHLEFSDTTVNNE